MCGRYAASRDPEDLVEEFEVVERPEQALPPNWNVAPTKDVYAVLERPPRGEPEAAAGASCESCTGGWCRPGRRIPRSATA